MVSYTSSCSLGRNGPRPWHARAPQFVTTVEQILHEGGPPPATPRQRAAIAAVVENPFAGRYVEEIAGLMEDLKPLGVEMARRLVDALGGDPKAVEGYGKAAIVGEAGESSTGACGMPGRLCHARASRQRQGDRALGEGQVASAAPRRPHHPYQRHAVFAAISMIEIGVADAPRSREIVFVLAMTTGPRVHARVGGLAAKDIKGEDGLR